MKKQGVKKLLLMMTCVALPGCGSARHAGDKTHLDSLASFQPEAIWDNRGRVSELTLENKAVDDAALDHVRHFQELRRLSLFRTKVTDAGLAKLLDLKKLEALGLGETRITDKGLDDIAKMTSLRWVWYSEGDKTVTPAGITRLQKARPGLALYNQ